MRKECLDREKKLFYRVRKVKMNSDFALNLYIEIPARWIEDLSRSIEH